MTLARGLRSAGALALALIAAAGLALRLWSRRVQPQGAAEARAGALAYAPAAPAAPGPEAHAHAAAQAEGRRAVSPGEIPARGWWQIAKRVFEQISEDRVLAEAAGVTFYVLLAIFPALATLVSIYGLLADPKTIANQLSAVSGFLPDGGVQILHDQIASLTAKPSGGLGLSALIGLLTSTWSANAGMKALFDALNVVYDEKEKRSFILRTALTLAFTLGAIVFLVLAMSGVVVLPAVLDFVGLGSTATTLLSLARWPVLLVVLSLFLAAVYRYGPSRQIARWRWVSWGSSGATLLWLLVSVAFSYYVQNFGNYNKTYGSLGAAIGFMTWIWLSASVVLIGAELNAETEHQTERDSTVGPEKRPGEREAAMANAVAPG